MDNQIPKEALTPVAKAVELVYLQFKYIRHVDAAYWNSLRQ